MNLHFFKNTMIHFLVLVALALLISILRLHYYDWPPNRDVTEYAVTSHEILSGKKLYSEIWNPKPPAIFISYSAAEALFGYGPRAIYLMNLVCSLIILSGVYAAGLASGYGIISGIWAALFWTALSGDVSFQLHDANTEVFMNACLIWAFVLFLAPTDRTFRYSRAVLIGILFAWASLYKHVIAVIPFVLSIAHIGIPPAGTSRRQAAIQILIIFAIGAVSWGVVVAYMALTDRFQIFYDTMITHALAYAGSPSRNVAGAISSSNLLEGVRRYQVVIPLLALASAGILYCLIKERSRAWALIVMYALGACISIALPGKFYRHYFQLGIPPLVVAGGWATAVLGQKAARLRASAPHIAAAAVLFFIVADELPYYASQPEVQLKGTYAEVYLVTQTLGRKVASKLQPGETMFHWGAESGLYFFSKKRPPGQILGWSLWSQTFGEQFTMQTLTELENVQPDIVIVAKYFVEIHPDHPILNWIYENYCLVTGLSEQEDKYFVLMERCVSPTKAKMFGLND